MAIPRRPHPSYTSAHHTLVPAPPPISFPPRNIPNALFYPQRTLETSILGKPLASPLITWPRFPPMDEGGFQPVLSRNTRRRLRQSSSQCSFGIEAKTFSFIIQESNRGVTMQISKQRPPVTRSILLSVAPVPWLKNLLTDCIHRRQISAPLWHQPSKSCFRAFASVNSRGRFLSITEHSIDGQVFSICIPQGRDTSGWSHFLSKLPPLLLHLRFSSTVPASISKAHSETSKKSRNNDDSTRKLLSKKLPRTPMLHPSLPPASIPHSSRPYIRRNQPGCH